MIRLAGALACLGLAALVVAVLVLLRDGVMIACFGFFFPVAAVCTMMALTVVGLGRSSLRKPAIWVAGAFVYLGLAMAGIITYLVLVNGGGPGLMIARLGCFVLPVAVVCAMRSLAALGVGSGSLNPRLYLWVAVAVGVLGTLVIPFLALRSRAWGNLLWLIRPVGCDFHYGVYVPAAAFSSATSAWPPLTLVLGLPFTLLSWSSGYVVQVILLVGMAISVAALSAGLAARVADNCSPEAGNWGKSNKEMFLLLTFWLVASCGFLLEVQRGNVNMYALLFSLLSVWFLLRPWRPGEGRAGGERRLDLRWIRYRFPVSMWLSVVFLAAAINVKIYPALLLVLVFWRYRWRALVPVVVSNAALLLIAGPSNLWHFIANNISLANSTEYWHWLGNASAANYASYLREALGWLPTWITYLLLAVPIALWVATAVLLIRRGWSQRRAVILAAASVPLMDIVPQVSHDYKLVLMVFPLAVLAALLTSPATAARVSPSLRGGLKGLLALEMVLLMASTWLWVPGPYEWYHVLGNKYPLLVLMQLLFLGVVLFLEPNSARELSTSKQQEPGEALPLLIRSKRKRLTERILVRNERTTVAGQFSVGDDTEIGPQAATTIPRRGACGIRRSAAIGGFLVVLLVFLAAVCLLLIRGPQTPVILSAPTTVLSTAVSTSQITLVWNAVAGADSYQVWRSIGTSGSYTQIAIAASPHYTDAGLVQGTRYNYEIRAVTGSASSGFSQVRTVYTKPAVPMRLKASAASTTEILLTWDAVPGASGYEVWQSTGTSTSYSRVGVAGRYFDNTGLVAGTQYNYKIRAVAGNASSDYSVVKTAYTKPGVPAGPKVSAVGPTQINLAWNTVAGASAYQVYRSTGTSTTYGEIATVTSPRYFDSGLTAGTRYSYEVYAIGAGGLGPPCAPAAGYTSR